MIRISSSFTPIVTVRLLNRSARKPPAMENRMNGSENKRRRQRHQRVVHPLRQRHVQPDERDHHLEGVVVERALELGDDQAPEPAQQRLGGFR